MVDMTISQPPTAEVNVAVKKFNQDGKTYLHFLFRNKFDLESAKEATTLWNECCQNQPNQKFIHIWDCQQMTGFDKAAKDLWMEYLKKYEGQTEKIQLVSDNIIIRGAARIMSRFSNHSIEVYKSLNEIL